MNTRSSFDLILRGGHVIDPANRIDAVMDVAIAGKKIALVAANIPTGTALSVVDITGHLVTPGLLDILPMSILFLRRLPPILAR